MEIGHGAAKLSWYFIVSWSRATCIKLCACKPDSPFENSASFAVKF